MSKNISLLIFLALLTALLGASWALFGELIPKTGDQAIWFYGGLLTLLVGKFVVEYRFTKPNDVFVNCLTAFIAISTLSEPPHGVWWEGVRWGALICGLLALALAWDAGREAKLQQRPIRMMAYRTVTRLGSAEVISSIVFVLALITYFDLNDAPSRVFAILWGIVLIASKLDLGRFAQDIMRARQVRKREILGVTYAFLSPSIVFFRKLITDPVSPHELVCIAPTFHGQPSCYGMTIDERASAHETLIAVALLNETVGNACLTDTSLVMKVSSEDQKDAATALGELRPEALKRIVGTVAKGTNISQVRFELFGAPPISAGSLLSVTSATGHVFYQVFQGVVEKEATIRESHRAFVQGEAEQIGLWNSEQGGFQTHNWVAKETSLVHLVDQNARAPEYELGNAEITLGQIPNSPYPANVDLNDLVLFHTGILGVTGSGKTFLTYDLVEQCAARGIKVVCVDPTGDYQRYLHPAVLLGGRDSLSAFLTSNNHQIAILEPASTNQHPIKQTKDLAQACLDWCRGNRTDEDVLQPRPKVLIVLEEAHLLIPEWNFNPNRGLQDTVNETSQVVLQARKYGLGFLVISQRTANVVKSVLNQCNTIVSFQAFDETGFDFLRNYMGAFHVASLPNLQSRQGILVGKASLSSRPIMVRFRDQEREIRAEPASPMPIQTNVAAGQKG
jgi:uncharacterized protein